MSVHILSICSTPERSVISGNGTTVVLLKLNKVVYNNGSALLSMKLARRAVINGNHSYLDEFAVAYLDKLNKLIDWAEEES